MGKLYFRVKSGKYFWFKFDWKYCSNSGHIMLSNLALVSKSYVEFRNKMESKEKRSQIQTIMRLKTCFGPVLPMLAVHRHGITLICEFNTVKHPYQLCETKVFTTYVRYLYRQFSAHNETSAILIGSDK